MKYFIYTLIVIGIILISYNITFLNFSNLTEGESGVALIGILAGACAILLLLILMVSKKIANKKR